MDAIRQPRVILAHIFCILISSLVPIAISNCYIPLEEYGALYSLYNITNGPSWNWRNDVDIFGAIWDFFLVNRMGLLSGILAVRDGKDSYAGHIHRQFVLFLNWGSHFSTLVGYWRTKYAIFKIFHLYKATIKTTIFHFGNILFFLQRFIYWKHFFFVNLISLLVFLSFNSISL